MWGTSGVFVSARISEERKKKKREICWILLKLCEVGFVQVRTHMAAAENGRGRIPKA